MRAAPGKAIASISETLASHLRPFSHPPMMSLSLPPYISTIFTMIRLEWGLIILAFCKSAYRHEIYPVCGICAGYCRMQLVLDELRTWMGTQPVHVSFASIIAVVKYHSIHFLIISVLCVRSTVIRNAVSTMSGEFIGLFWKSPLSVHVTPKSTIWGQDICYATQNRYCEPPPITKLYPITNHCETHHHMNSSSPVNSSQPPWKPTPHSSWRTKGNGYVGNLSSLLSREWRFFSDEFWCWVRSTVLTDRGHGRRRVVAVLTSSNAPKNSKTKTGFGCVHWRRQTSFQVTHQAHEGNKPPYSKARVSRWVGQTTFLALRRNWSQKPVGTHFVQLRRHAGSLAYSSGVPPRWHHQCHSYVYMSWWLIEVCHFGPRSPR
jgi:hypothetical protein